MNDQISRALEKLFERRRIVFWYDTECQMREEFKAVSLRGVEKLELKNNEYGIKYRLLRGEPKRKFLLYREGPKPSDLENWLLDIELAHEEFRTDREAIWLSELGLRGEKLLKAVRLHSEFFTAKKRRDSLRKILQPDDDAGSLRLKMLAVCAGTDPRIDAVVESLLGELADCEDEKIRLVARCSLDGFLWEQIDKRFSYSADEPDIEDFAVGLFKASYAAGAVGDVALNRDAVLFFRGWKDNRKNEVAFETLSERYAGVLEIERKLSDRDFRSIMEIDCFQLIDQKIISDLVQAISSRTVSVDEVDSWVRRRREGYWYRKYKRLYDALSCAARFIHDLEKTDFSMNSFTDGIKFYADSWYRLDQLYRQYTCSVTMSGHASLMEELTDKIEKMYSNSYLLKVNDRFQPFVDSAGMWRAPNIFLQRKFFYEWIWKLFLSRNKKVCVIISDAMRYEIGNELLDRIRKEDRYEATISPALCMLPSYTQLGMASLLPNKELGFSDDSADTVLVDGIRSAGISGRRKILEKEPSGRATALKAEEVTKMKNDDCRGLVRDNDVIYVYHDRIDAAGDSTDSEHRVFEEVENTLKELVQLIKKLAGANANNLLVTSDHGFIYQDRAIDESDFSGSEVKGDEIWVRKRRFAIGRGLTENRALRKFTSAELGLAGDAEVQIPKSINRLRRRGSGSRFVHGGSSLQEIVIPILRINKKRKSNMESVEVDILSGASSIITSGQFGVILYQCTAATNKIRPRTLRAGIYTESGELISDSHDLIFDITSENPRDRERQVRFALTRRSAETNNQEVVLRLEEQHAETSHYKEYKSQRYTMRRSFASDFDI